MSLSVFGFQALWSPYLIGLCVFLTVLYFLITVAWRNDFKVSEPLKRSEAIYFILAMITLYIIKGSPIDLLGHIMFTMHMVQMAFLLLLVPILLIKGIPWWIWKVVAELPVIKTLVKVLTQPVIAIFIFIGLFSVYHIPSVFDAIKLDASIHGLFTFILFLSALFMYWPLLNKVEGQHKMKNILKLAYIAANAVLITPACALIIFANAPMYETYTNPEMWMQAMALCVPASTLSGLTLTGPELFSNMNPVSDQQVGGVLMKIIQEIIFGAILYRVFMDWWKNERKNSDDITEQSLKDFQNRSMYN